MREEVSYKRCQNGVFMFLPFVVAAKRHPKAVAQTLPAPIDLNLVLRVGLQEAQGVAAPARPCPDQNVETA